MSSFPASIKSRKAPPGEGKQKEEKNQSLSRSLLNENKSIALITNRTFNDPQEIVGENYFNFLSFPLLHLHLFVVCGGRLSILMQRNIFIVAPLQKLATIYLAPAVVVNCA